MRSTLARRATELAATVFVLVVAPAAAWAQVAPEWPNGRELRELPGCLDHGERGVCFDFESNDEMLWRSPGWARTEGGYFPTRLSRSTENAFLNDASLRMDVRYLEGRWSAAVIDLPVEMSLAGYRRLTARLFLPRGAVSAGLEARFVVVADRWLWFETLDSAILEPGRWVTLQVSLEPGRLRDSWSVAKRGAELADSIGDIRGVLIRIESPRDRDTPREAYSGNLFVDDIRFER